MPLPSHRLPILHHAMYIENKLICQQCSVFTLRYNVEWNTFVLTESRCKVLQSCELYPDFLQDSKPMTRTAETYCNFFEVFVL